MKTRTCKHCDKTKTADLFIKGALKCKSCASVYMKDYYKKNKEKTLAWSRQYYKDHVEEKAAYGKARRKSHPEKSYRVNKNWSDKNPGRTCYYSANYYARKLHRTLLISDEKKILSFYQRAADMTAKKGIPHHVDHIIPLNGKNVSGLHVHWNLQVLTATANLKKGNKYEESDI